MTLSDKLMERYGKPHLSYSSIKQALGDIRKFDKYMKGEIKYTSKALEFGNVYDDMLFMTDDEFNGNYYSINEDEVIEGLSDKTKAAKNIKATKEYKETIAGIKGDNEGSTLVSVEDMKMARDMVSRLEDCGLRDSHLSGKFQVEFLHELPDENGEPVLVKGFLDCLGDGFITDSKSAASVQKFGYAVRDFCYDIQAFIYTQVFDINDFYWVVQEKTDPYLPALVKCTDKTIFSGEMKFYDSISRINNFLDNPEKVTRNYYEVFEI